MFIQEWCYYYLFIFIDVIFFVDDVYKKYMIEFMCGVVQNLVIIFFFKKKIVKKKIKYSIFVERYYKIGCFDILNVY